MKTTGSKETPLFKSALAQYAIVLVVIATVVILCIPLADKQSYHIVSFILLFVVSIMAAFLGIGPVLLASTVSALVWNYFFIPPYYTFHIAGTEDKLMFGSFFVVALLNGILTNRIRRQEALAKDREERTNAIYELTRDLSNAGGIKEVLAVASEDLKKYFDFRFIRFLGDTARINEHQTAGESNDSEIIEWVRQYQLKAGRFTDVHNSAQLTYYPMAGISSGRWVVAVSFEKKISVETETFWSACLTQISNAIERELLTELALRARVLDESDRLYKTLFTLISHEFRIPIATIMGASDTLLMTGAGGSDRNELLDEIVKASARLNHLIENLLSMSRLESGKISVKPDWCDINDLLNNVLKVIKKELEQFHFTGEVAPEMPLVKLDFGLMEQVIYNLILNSVRHTPPGSTISFFAGYNGGRLVLRIEDNGPGFPEEMIGKVFDKFFRVDNSKTGGLGLGLSIVKGLTEAHGGTVKAENRQDGGARFSVIIPCDITEIKEIRLE